MFLDGWPFYGKQVSPDFNYGMGRLRNELRRLQRFTDPLRGREAYANVFYLSAEYAVMMNKKLRE